MKSISVDPEAWEDFLFWLSSDRKTARRITRLIAEIQRDPFTGIGKPEPLKGNCRVIGPGGSTTNIGWYTEQTTLPSVHPSVRAVTLQVAVPLHPSPDVERGPTNAKTCIPGKRCHSSGIGFGARGVCAFVASDFASE